MLPLGSRALAPAPSLAAEATQSPSSQSASLPIHHATAGIRRASTACQSCKQIKRKCDQAHPCSNCRKSNTRCVYNEAEDGRRKAARKRTVESLELKRDALDSILDSFRSSSDLHAQNLLQLIRSNAPLDEIVRYATAHGSTNPQREVQDALNNVDDQPRKSVMSVAALCDTPLFLVRSQPWTSVTADDDFVSHLTSVFFTWYYPAYPSLDRDRFLHDMSTGDLNCRFCSPLLVNAMLALACNFSDHPMSCSIPSDASTRGQHFFDEAVRLWVAEEGKPSLLNVQAVSFLAVAACLLGKDRLSWSYIESMNEMSQELQVKHQRTRQKGSSNSTSEVQESEILTSHTGFLLTVGYGIAFMKPASSRIESTRAVLPPLSPRQLVWIPYPQRFPESTYDLSLLLEAFCELHSLGLQIQMLLFGSTTNESVPKALEIDQLLTTWAEALPSTLQLGPDSSAVVPPILDLHLMYHFLRLTLHHFPKENHERSASEPAARPPELSPTSDGTSRSPASGPRTHLDPVRQVPMSAPPAINHSAVPQLPARSSSFEAAKAIAQLCQRFSRDFGLKQPTMWMPQAAASAAYSLIDPATPLHEPEIADIFHELCSVLTAASRRWLVMKGHVRMLFMTAETQGQKLLPKTKQLLRFLALDQWGESDHKLFASSAFPNYALAKDGADPRLNGMGDLLELWAGMKTDDDIAPRVDETVVVSMHSGRVDNMATRQSGNVSLHRGHEGE